MKATPVGRMTAQNQVDWERPRAAQAKILIGSFLPFSTASGP
jgi:hypothetical protein